jgi:hypothetical protein
VTYDYRKSDGFKIALFGGRGTQDDPHSLDDVNWTYIQNTRLLYLEDTKKYKNPNSNYPIICRMSASRSQVPRYTVENKHKNVRGSLAFYLQGIQ